MAGLQKVEGRLVVEIQPFDIGHVLAGRGDIAQRTGNHGQGFQAEEVEFHETRRFDPFHVELGGGNVGARIAIERNELGQFTVTNHHTGGVGRSVAEQAFQLQGDGQQRVDGIVIAAHFAQPGFDIEGLGQGDRIGRVGRHHLGEPVDQAQRQLQDPAGIAHHGTGLKGAEGDDLGDPVMPVLFLHIADHLAASFLTEVDVEIGHGDPLGIEEAFEQKTKAQRVEIGDGQRIGDQRAGARTPARPDRYVVILGPLDKVRNDQEIARESHLLDDVELEVETGAVVRLGRRRIDAGQPVGQAFMGARDQLLDLGPAALGREAGQDRRVGADPKGAAAGNFDRVGQRFRQVGKARIHLFRRGQVVVRRHPAPVGDRDEGAFRDTQQGVMGLVHRLVREIGLIGRNQGQIAGIGLADQPVLGFELGFKTVTLQLDIKPVAKGRCELVQIGRGLRLPTARDQTVEKAIRPAGQGNQPRRVIEHQAERDVRLFRPVDIQIGGAGKRHQIAIAGLVLGQQDQCPVRLGALARMRVTQTDFQRTPDNRLDPSPGQDLGKLKRPEKIVCVRQRDRRHAMGLAGLDHFGHADRALEHGVRRPNPQMHKR